MTPEERLLESLGKYGEQTREVQLTLHHNGPSLCAENGPGTDAVRLRGPRYQSGGGQLRRAHAAGHGHRGSEARNLNRQSLPPLSRLRFQSEPIPEETKKPKRKSLTLMEEAWGWLESLGRSGRQQSGPREKVRGRDDHRGGTSDTANRLSQSFANQPGQVICHSPLPQGRNRREKGQASEGPKVISCLGNFGRDGQEDDKKMRAEAKVQKGKRKELQANLPFLKVEELHVRASREVEEQKEELRALILQQQSSLGDLQSQIDTTDGQICMLEEQQRKRQAEQEVSQARLQLLEEEEAEQLHFWENELKDEEGFEKDLQQQFLELKEKAAECRATLQEYQRKLEGLDLSSSLAHLFPKREVSQSKGGARKTPRGHSTIRTPVHNKELSESAGSKQSAGNSGRQPGGTASTKLPRVFVAPVQTAESGMSDRSRLREWWARWSAGQSSSTGTGHKPQAIHRSEITICLSSTRV